MSGFPPREGLHFPSSPGIAERSLKEAGGEGAPVTTEPEKTGMEEIALYLSEHQSGASVRSRYQP